MASRKGVPDYAFCPTRAEEGEASESHFLFFLFWVFPIYTCAIVPVVISFDTSVVASVASSAVCAVIFAASSLVVSTVSFVHPSGGGSSEPCRKRHREDSSSSTEKMEMWAKFEKIRAACKCPSERLLLVLRAGHNFKALFCTPTYLSLQFLHPRI